MIENVSYCKKCVMHTGIKEVVLDKNGICNFCHWDEQLNHEHPINKVSLDRLLNKIRERGRGREYDVVIGLSGGTDSSYLLKKMVENKIRCLAVHVDNNWNTKTAIENMDAITSELGVDFHIRRLDKKMYNMLIKSFLLASVADVDAPLDIAIVAVPYQIAEKYDIPTIIDGHCFRTEGTAPLSWSYMDGKYIESVNSQFMKADLSKYPNLLLRDWLRWLSIPRYRPLYYIDYVKAEARKELNKIGWVDYGGHHCEHRFTIFVGAYIWAKKFNYDLRYVAQSAMIRNHQMTREEVLRNLKTPQVCPQDIIDDVKKNLGFTDEEFDTMMKLSPKNHFDYEYYDFANMKQIFDEYRDLLPRTFIDKYVDKTI